MELYEKIVILRRKKGLSQQELADKLDISRQSVYKWEQGLSSPDISKLKLLSDILDISLDILLDDSRDVTEKNSVIETEENNDNSKKSNSSKSMLDYMLMIPFGLGMGILIAMFYMFGYMSVAFLYVFLAFAVIGPVYGVILLFINASMGAGAILLSIAVIVGSIGSIYPLILASNKWRVKFLSLVKKVNNYIKNIKWRNLI